MGREYFDEHAYTEASVPTPHDQEDVSAIDMVSDAIEEITDNTRDDFGFMDYTRRT